MRRRNLSLEKSIASKHGALLGIPAEDMLKIIDAREGDFWDVEKHPQADAAFNAINNFMFGGHNDPLAQELRGELGKFYGLQTKAAPAAPVTNAPVTTAPVEPVVRTINITKPQGPKAPPAQGPRRSFAPKPVQDFKDAKVQQVIDTNPNVIDAKTQEILAQDQLMAAEKIQELSDIGPKAAQELEQQADNDLMKTALLIAAAGGTGAIGGSLLSGPKEPELSDEEKLALYLSQT